MMFTDVNESGHFAAQHQKVPMHFMTLEMYRKICLLQFQVYIRCQLKYTRECNKNAKL